MHTNYRLFVLTESDAVMVILSAGQHIWSDGGTVSHGNLASLSTAPNRRRKSAASASF